MTPYFNLKELADKFGCAVHAYVLMTNHVHLPLTPARENSAGLLIKQLGQRYVQYINRTYQRSSTLWEGRFPSCLTQVLRTRLAGRHRHGKCPRADPRAKLRGGGHRRFLGEGDETFIKESEGNAVLQDLTPYFIGRHRQGKCLRADSRAKLRGKDHRQFPGEGDETFMEDSGRNALLQDLTPLFCTDAGNQSDLFSSATA